MAKIVDLKQGTGNVFPRTIGEAVAVGGKLLTEAISNLDEKVSSVNDFISGEPTGTVNVAHKATNIVIGNDKKSNLSIGYNDAIKINPEGKITFSENSGVPINTDNTVKLSKVTPSGDLQHYMYELIGAIYNDTGSDIVRNAPWADLVDDDYDQKDKYVTHKAGCWYMNGLGDLTNDDMRNILVYGQASDVPKLFRGCTNLKTSYNKKMANLDISYGQIFQSSSFLVLGDYNIYMFNSGLPSLFQSCTRLKAIFAIISFLSVSSTSVNMFNSCNSLQYVKLLHLNSNIYLQWSPLLSVKSVLYMINNARTTNNFIITLHDDAYTRAVQNGDILAALEAKPNITLASASGEEFNGTTTTSTTTPQS